MKRSFLPTLLSLVIIVLAMGCERQLDNVVGETEAALVNQQVMPAGVWPAQACAQATAVPVMGAGGFAIASFTTVNDEDDLYLVFEAVPGFKLIEAYAWVGEYNTIPGGGNARTIDPYTFPMSRTLSSPEDEFSFKVPLGMTWNCNEVMAYVKVAVVDPSNGNTLFLDEGWADGKPVTAGGFTKPWCNVLCATQTCEPWMGGSNPCAAPAPAPRAEAVNHAAVAVGRN